MSMGSALTYWTRRSGSNVITLPYNPCTNIVAETVLFERQANGLHVKEDYSIERRGNRCSQEESCTYLLLYASRLHGIIHNLKSCSPRYRCECAQCIRIYVRKVSNQHSLHRVRFTGKVCECYTAKLIFRPDEITYHARRPV